MAVAALLAATRPYHTDTVTVRTSEGVELLDLTCFASDDSVSVYSSHIAPIRNKVTADAWIALKPAPKLLVAGVMISPPGAATHLNVARWFNGTSSNSWLAV